MQINSIADAVHNELLNICDYVHNICEKEGIDYSLCGGSMIGAVRHKGFIPWDEDIDLVMKRADGMRFAEAVKKYPSDDYFYCFDLVFRAVRVSQRKPVVFEGTTVPHVAVDILYLDNLPDDPRKRKRLLTRLAIIKGEMKKGLKLDWSKYSFKEKVLVRGARFLGHFSSLRRLNDKHEKLAAKYNNQETKEMFMSNNLYRVFRMPYKREWFDKIISVPFEDRTYKMYENYDPILRTEYGDYMTPPPEDQRVLHLKIYGGYVKEE